MNNSNNTQGPDMDSKKGQRAPWSGNLDGVECKRPGGLLMAALVSYCYENKIEIKDMAMELGVTSGYINQLRHGIRKIEHVSDEFSYAISCYLGVPRMTVLFLSGRLVPEDYFESQEIMSGQISSAMAFIYSDRNWGYLVTPELRSSSEASQFGLIRMYEAATGKYLLKKEFDLNGLVKNIIDLKKVDK